MKTHYIIDSAAALLGVSLIIVTAVHITGRASQSIADELSYGAALLFLGTTGLSHFAISKSDDRYEEVAYKLFAVALLLLFFGVLSFWF